MPILATAALLLGGCLCLLNCYLSFLRYPLHRWRGGTQADYRPVTGAPLVGSLLVALSLLAFWPTTWLRVAALTLIALDTGGLHWFVGSLLYRRLTKGA